MIGSGAKGKQRPAANNESGKTPKRHTSARFLCLYLVTPLGRLAAYRHLLGPAAATSGRQRGVRYQVCARAPLRLQLGQLDGHLALSVGRRTIIAFVRPMRRRISRRPIFRVRFRFGPN